MIGEPPLLLSKCLKLSTKEWSINQRMLQFDTTGISYYTKSSTALHQIKLGEASAKKGIAISAIITVKSLCEKEDRRQIKRFGTLPSDHTFKIVFKKPLMKLGVD